MAALQESHPWTAEVIDLHRKGVGTNDIAEAVGKHPATIRKAIAKAREEGTLTDETQTTVSDFAEGDDRIVWTGENRQQVAKFLGRGENGTIHAQKIDLPTLDDARMVQATPGDTIVRVGEEAYDVIPDPERDPLEDFKAEAGEATGDLQPRPGEEPAGELEPEPPLMPGTRQLALDFGPNAAPVHEAAVQFKSEKWPSGHFGMGDVVTGTFTARVVGIPAKEAFDKDSEEFRAKPITYAALITEIEYEPVDPGE